MVLFAPIRQIHRRHGLDASDARAATLACLLRHRVLYLAAPLAAGAMACFVAWWTFGVLLMLLDPLRIELFPDASTAIGVPLYLLLGLALCLAAALTMFTIARRGLVPPRTRRDRRCGGVPPLPVLPPRPQPRRRPCPLPRVRPRESSALRRTRRLVRFPLNALAARRITQTHTTTAAALPSPRVQPRAHHPGPLRP